MTSALTSSEYNTLLNDIVLIYQGATRQMEMTSNKIRVKAYWDIGRRIVHEEQRHHLRAEYGTRLLDNLSEHLTQKFGSGFSVTNLRYMRQFYQRNPIHQTSDELSWSHHQVLSSIPDSDKRQNYEKRASQNSWSVRDLKSNLRQDQVEFEPITERRPVITPTEEREGEPLPESKDGRLIAGRGRLHTYRIVESKALKLYVDCGFNVWRDVLLARNTALRAGDVVEVTEEGVAKVDSGAKLFTFKAQVERIIDGDTILCQIDCDFDTVVRQRLRLRGINTPELTTTKGQKAKMLVESAFKQVEFIIVKTYSTDVHGRYLADIFYLPKVVNEEHVLEQGKYLNQELLDLGLAVRV